MKENKDFWLHQFVFKEHTGKIIENKNNGQIEAATK